MTEATVIPENAAPAQTEETARHGLPESVVEARLGLFLVPRRSPAHAVRENAHVFPGHEGLVLLLTPDRRRQGKWGGSSAVTSLRTHVRHYFAVEPSHSARGLFQRLHVNEHETLHKVEERTENGNRKFETGEFRDNLSSLTGQYQ